MPIQKNEINNIFHIVAFLIMIYIGEIVQSRGPVPGIYSVNWSIVFNKYFISLKNRLVGSTRANMCLCFAILGQFTSVLDAVIYGQMSIYIQFSFTQTSRQLTALSRLTWSCNSLWWARIVSELWLEGDLDISSALKVRNSSSSLLNSSTS